MDKKKSRCFVFMEDMSKARMDFTKEDYVSINLIPLTPTKAFLELIRAETKGKGHGSKALRKLCELADKHKISISGQCAPCSLDGAGLDWNQLTAWYERHGFKFDSSGIDMCRKPPRANQMRRSTAVNFRFELKEGL